MSAEKEAVDIKVPSKDPNKLKDLEPTDPEKIIRDDNAGPVEESEEDKLLREMLEAAVRKLTTGNQSLAVHKKALATLSNEIKTATSSMTSVPKPLKFLRPFYQDLKNFYQSNSPSVKDSVFRKDLADVLSVLGMTMASEGSREMLEFKLLGNRQTLGEWGHEFVRALCGEISQEYSVLSIKEGDEVTGSAALAGVKERKKDLTTLAHNIVPFLIKQNTETEAVDLLFEVEELKFLVQTSLIDKSNYERTCLYLMKFAEFLFEKKDLDNVLGVAYELYMNCDDLPNALRVAMKLNNQKMIKTIMNAKFGETKTDGVLMKKQLALMLGDHKMFSYEDADDEINDLINNANLSSYFQTLALNLNMQEPKSTEDVYKTYLEDKPTFRNKDVNAESARQNLAASYVNGFVNCAFEKDSLLQKPQAAEPESKDEPNWVFKNRDYGKTAAVASLGLINLWSLGVGSNELSRWVDKAQEDVLCLAGGLLGLGVINCGVRDANSEIAYSLISEVFAPDDKDKRKDHKMVRACGALGVGLAYAGNPSQGPADFLKEMLENQENEFEVRSLSALALGFMYVGSGNMDIAGIIVEAMFDFSTNELENINKAMGRFFALGLALVFMGQQEEAATLHLQTIEAIENKAYSKFAKTLLRSCAYAGSGNVIQVQALLHLCAEHLEEEAGAAAPPPTSQAEADKEDKKKKEEQAQKATYQAVAVLGVALITFGESVGRQMAERSFQHLLQYGDLPIRRAVPLAIALSHISDPDYGLVDLLSKLTHDADKQTSMCAILALGLMGAGTTNSRVAQLLRQLAVFYSSEGNVLFVVRLAQGLLFCGKGLTTMHPFHSDKALLSHTALAGILTVLIAALDMKNTLLTEFHVLMFCLACAIRPRMLMTMALSETNKNELEQVKVKVRVGQAVETVGQAGNPKKITGFQNQETPVLLNVGDRAEIATDEYEPMASTLEGVVILKKIEKKGGK